jgi:cobalt/nickel transport system permease protein
MHIPNGFIPWWQCIIYGVILIVALYFSQKWARKNLDERTVPLFAVLAAGIFAIMSMNIPIYGGTSGHMVGGALVAIIFCAPEAAIIIFTLVLLAQALIFGDGGFTVLGANVLNMGIIGGVVGLYSFKALRKPVGKVPAIAIASWLSIFLAAEAVAVEMWLAGTFPLGLGLTAMGFWHAGIGVIEAILTVVVIMALESVRPDLLAWNRKKTADDSESEKIEVTAK